MDQEIHKARTIKEPRVLITISFSLLVLSALVTLGLAAHYFSPEYYVGYVAVIKLLTAIVAVRGYKPAGAKMYEYLIMTLLMFMPIGNLIVIFFAGKSLARDFVNRAKSK